jgi:tetratricopeptide (TPR) repeat protein
MKKNLGFGEAIELYLRKVVGRSPLPWPVIGIGLIIIVFGVSLKYSRDTVVGAKNIQDVVELAAKSGDYQTARELLKHYNIEPLDQLGELVYPERKVQNKIDELEQSLEIYPESREIYLAIAELYKQLGNAEKASKYLEKARILSPND